MKEEELLELLTRRNVQPTAIRILVLKALLNAQQSVSLLDLENMLETVDKSTIFRTLSLFHSHHVVHSIDDGTGSFKYALCDPNCDCEIDDLHTHFHCTQCNRTFCFKNIPTPMVNLPEGFSYNSINYVIMGICAECAAKTKKTF